MTHLVINQGAHGLGDGLQGLLAVCGLQQDHPPGTAITYKCGPTAVPFVKLFWPGECRKGEWDHNKPDFKFRTNDLQLNKGYALELRSRGEEPRWERYMKNAGASQIVIPTLHLRDHLTRLGEQHQGKLGLCLWSANPEREPARPALLHLESELIRWGWRPLIIAGDGKRVRPFQSEKLVGAEPAVVASALLNCSVVLAVDTGLAHLSAMLGRPTVVISGQTRGEQIYGCYEKVSYIRGTLPCVGCYWQPGETPWSHHWCRPHCPALAGIDPESVHEMLVDVTRYGFESRRLDHRAVV